MVAVQIVESSVVGTRCAVLRCTRRGGGPVVLVFPMLHVAAPEFYREVERQLRECDLLVVEGIIGDSAVGGALTTTYKVIPANDDSGLVEDDIPYDDLGVPIVTPDLTGDEFDEGFGKLPWKTKLFTWAAVPVVSVGQFFAGRRAILNLEVNDLPTRSEELRGENLDEFMDLLLDRRDERVLTALAEIVRDRAEEKIDVAVVYGAGHVPGILRGLYKLGYRVVSADWVMAVPAE
ncbi:hypothetical protein EV652_10457 [Kribbella steppae]|uniref:TraB family protein n=2 Tax=Kribbella steppae TaxID=2512223 RepID=A0A4R2HMF8_9ACTN|nr:hypothetical protein EV652_10457 [Kribbella steppae]